MNKKAFLLLNILTISNTVLHSSEKKLQPYLYPLGAITAAVLTNSAATSNNLTWKERAGIIAGAASFSVISQWAANNYAAKQTATNDIMFAELLKNVASYTLLPLMAKVLHGDGNFTVSSTLLCTTMAATGIDVLLRRK